MTEAEAVQFLRERGYVVKLPWEAIDFAAIACRYQAGETLDSVAAETGWTRHKIKAALIEMGVYVRPKCFAPGNTHWVKRRRHATQEARS
jgi:hypothetical protein